MASDRSTWSLVTESPSPHSSGLQPGCDYEECAVLCHSPLFLQARMSDDSKLASKSRMSGTECRTDVQYLPVAMYDLGPRSGLTRSVARCEATLSCPSGWVYSGKGKHCMKSCRHSPITLGRCPSSACYILVAHAHDACVHNSTHHIE